MVAFHAIGVDEPSAHELIAEYFAMRAQTFPPELGEYKPKFPPANDFVAPTGVFLVVEDDAPDDAAKAEAVAGGVAIGCGGVRMIAPGRFEIKHLYMRPAAQGRGLGRALLAELESRAKSLGATEIVLDTNASLAAAGNLYRSTGYVNIPPYNDNPNATDWFAKAL